MWISFTGPPAAMSTAPTSLLLSRVDNGLRDEFGVRTMVEVVSGQRDELMHTLRDRVNETFAQGIWH